MTKDTVQKQIRRCTFYILIGCTPGRRTWVPQHFLIGCTPVRRTWELFKSSCWKPFNAGHQICLGNGFPRACPSVFAWHSLIDSVKKKIRAYRQSFSAWLWAAEVIRPLHWDLKKLTSSVSGLSDALGLSDMENLFTVLISISRHHVFEISKNAT